MDDLDSLVNRHLIEVGRRIEAEQDSTRRSELMLWLSMLNAQKEINTYMKETRVEHNRRITDTEQKITKHEELVIQARTTIRIFSIIWTAVSASFIAVLLYGYSLIANIRDTVTKQSAILPRLEQIIDSSRRQEAALPRIEKSIDEKDMDFDAKIDIINKELERLKRLKVIRGSK